MLTRKERRGKRGRKEGKGKRGKRKHKLYLCKYMYVCVCEDAWGFACTWVTATCRINETMLRWGSVAKW
jgi:hypothetical protein